MTTQRRMTRITDDLGQSTDYVYDARGRMTKTIYSDHDGAGDEVVTLYAFGNSPVKRIDQRGIETRYAYNSHAQLITKQDAWTNPTITEAYSYDGYGRRVAALLVNAGTTVSDVRMYYDKAARLTRETQAIKGGTARVVDYMYDKAGNRTKMAYPGGKVINYTLDAANRVSTISDGANQRAVYAYVGPLRRSQVGLKDGANTVSTCRVAYDGMGQITSGLYRNAADNATIVGFEHSHDKNGNPQFERRTHQSNYGDAYMYDDLCRVTRVIYDDSTPANPTYAVTRSEDFLLDPIGNRTKIYAKSATATEYLHNPVNEYTKVAATPYEYDAAGNLTKDENFTYQWDYENRLTKVKRADNGNDVADYAYDATMRRIEKKDYTADPDATTRFYYDHWSDIEERDGDDALVATYVNGPGIDNYVTMERGGNTYWYMQSPLVGNVAALVNSSGTIQEGYKYDAYGKALVLTGAGNDATWFTADDTTATSSAIGNPFTFTGRRLDAETMLMYFRYRMYKPESGSFESRDPLGYVDGMNAYEYSRSNTLRYTDHFGLGIKITYECTLVKQTLAKDGCRRDCEYVCLEKPGSRITVHGAGNADIELPAKLPPIEEMVVKRRSFKAWFWGYSAGGCDPRIDTVRIVDNWGLPARDCSRSACKTYCDVADDPKKGCDLIDNPFYKTACKLALSGGKAACQDICTSWCEKN